MHENDFVREIKQGVIIEKVNMTRATMKEAQALKDRLLTNSAFGHHNMIVDLSQCSFVDSSIIGVLVVVLKRVRHMGGDLKVVVPTGNGFGIFASIGLEKIFTLHTSTEEALKVFDAGKFNLGFALG